MAVSSPITRDMRRVEDLMSSLSGATYGQPITGLGGGDQLHTDLYGRQQANLGTPIRGDANYTPQSGLGGTTTNKGMMMSAPETATSSTYQEPSFWGSLFDSGLIQGQRGYYEGGLGTIAGSEYTHAIRTALGGADDLQRRRIVDYLFDQGAASGDRNYWYTPRGAEDEDLIAAAANLGAVPPPADASPQDVITGDIDSLRQQRLDAVLAALDAQFGLERGGQEAELQSMMNLFRSGLAQNTRATEQASENAQLSAAERGIFRSGLTAEMVADAITPLAEERAALNARYFVPEDFTLEDLTGLVGNAEGQQALGTDMRAILQAIGLLGQEQAAAEAQARIESEQSALELDLMELLAEAGLA